MHGITKEQIGFFAMVWAIGFAASFCRTARDRDSLNRWHMFGLSATAGFVSFGVVSVLFVPTADGPNSSWYWLGVSALVGLLGKEQDQIAKAVLGKAFAISKVVFRDSEDKQGQ